jgi:DNA invertase Pin-like site-specific DNA recombinase
MKVGYKRVSTLEQNTARQLDGVALDKAEASNTLSQRLRESGKLPARACDHNRRWRLAIETGA